MAHSCPDCGCLCHCGGDIDDLDFGDEGPDADNCTHYLKPECGGHDDQMDSPSEYVPPSSQVKS